MHIHKLVSMDFDFSRKQAEVEAEEVEYDDYDEDDEETKQHIRNLEDWQANQSFAQSVYRDLVSLSRVSIMPLFDRVTLDNVFTFLFKRSIHPSLEMNEYEDDFKSDNVA